MKRRAFCAAGVSAAALSFLPFRRAFAADIPALTKDGAEIVLRASDVEDFRAGLRAGPTPYVRLDLGRARIPHERLLREHDRRGRSAAARGPT